MLHQIRDRIGNGFLRLARIREHPGDELTCLVAVEEAEGELLKVAIKLVAHVAHDAFTNLHAESAGRVEEHVLEQQPDHHHDDHVA